LLCTDHFDSLSSILELVKLVKGGPRNRTLKAGDCFGQEIIVDQQKYAATVVSLQTTTGWKIDRAVLANAVPVEKLRRSK
jgi:CRP-like cAMP-binding protein